MGVDLCSIMQVMKKLSSILRVIRQVDIGQA